MHPVSPPENMLGHALPNGVESSDTSQLSDSQISFVKNPKRKRLAKACDACHKSKRRCDGTAPCSNCYFATKACSYTDASGRSVPAPKTSEPMPHRTRDDRTMPDLPPQPIAPRQQHTDASTISQPRASSSHPRSSSQPDSGTSRKRHRSASDASNVAVEHKRVSSEPNVRPAGIEAHMVRELVNLFFAHCHPHRMIFHEPTFSTLLSQNKVPPFLVLATCAVAAPHSRSSQLRAKFPRMAGQRFYEEAVSLIFDANGILVCEPSLFTVQALCLLEMHEVNAQYAWTKSFRYHDLASKILHEDLQIQKPDPVMSSTPSPEELHDSLERECMRRCFWIIYFTDVLCTACTRRPSRFPSDDISIRLPVDETSFQLGVQTTIPEYLNEPAPNNNYASEFGHLLRITTIYARTEDYLAADDEVTIRHGLLKIGETLETWKASLPPHLRFSEEALETQDSMFETGSSGGAWCYYYMHATQACCSLSSAKAKYDLTRAEYSRMKECVSRIVSSLGSRAKNLNYLLAAVLWALSRYSLEDPDMHDLDKQFESMWGYKCLEIAPTWREHNREARNLEERPQTPDMSELRLRRASVGSKREGGERTLPSLKAVGLLNSNPFINDKSMDGLTSLPPLAGNSSWA